MSPLNILSMLESASQSASQSVIQTPSQSAQVYHNPDGALIFYGILAGLFFTTPILLGCVGIYRMWSSNSNSNHQTGPLIPLISRNSDSEANHP